MLILLADKWDEENRARRKAAFERKHVPKVPFRDKEVLQEELGAFNIKSESKNTLKEQSLNLTAGVGGVASNIRLTRNF